MLSVLIFMFSIDVILAKRFFPASVVGAYAVASLLGKTIFYATAPICKTMFPIVSGKEINSLKTIKKSILGILGIGIMAIIVFSLFPTTIINILFGEKYILIAPFLGLIGISFLILSLANLSMHYLLSFKKIKKIWIFLIFPLVQIILLSLFHASILEYIIALNISFLILLGGFLLMIKNGQD